MHKSDFFYAQPPSNMLKSKQEFNMEDAKTNRKHKDSVFTKLFGEKFNALMVGKGVEAKTTK